MFVFVAPWIERAFLNLCFCFPSRMMNSWRRHHCLLPGAGGSYYWEVVRDIPNLCRYICWSFLVKTTEKKYFKRHSTQNLFFK